MKKPPTVTSESGRYTNAQAAVTHLLVKDRVLAHNPVGALYASHSYYKRLSTDLDL